ncbi:hypothetical protein MSAN_01029800 [Mycena sanguinolenta]|uniref:F-box domain-containing protein n=1 Tax=Mycena sanguinolenta TaxID=230812 RepID=A0A8H6YM98_9AGAR|nr:hypothetical protein MSAN_01029800 [Mycena sanguinolenta]
MPLQPKSGIFKPADSPFVGLFEQSRAPSFEERKTVLELLVAKTAHLSHLNSQVPKRRTGKKHKVSSELRAELAYTRRWLEFHRALVSPWRQLPPEIMSEIFILTLKSRGTLDRHEAWIDDRAGTLLLCKICSTWRAIALRTPALWNTVSIRPFELLRPLEWVSTWLARSRSIPVHLQLLWDSQAHSDAINSVASVFVSHIHHTAELAIDGVFLFGHRLLIELDEAYPKLTFNPSVGSLNAPLLSTVLAHLPHGSVWDWIHAACRASPCLTHLTTSHSSLDSLTVANLTDLNWFREVPLSQIFRIFEDAPNLKHIDINVDGPGAPSSVQSRFNMKSISKLEITSYDHLHEFLGQAEFPSLVNLRICLVDLWPGPTFDSFLSHSSCALTILDFFDCIISPMETVASLKHDACETLESLSVEDCSGTRLNADALLEHLTYHGPERHLYNPTLRTIKLRDVGATDGLLAAIVESRCLSTTSSSGQPRPAPVRLSEVQFSFVDTDNHREDWKRLREIEERAKLKIGWPADRIRMHMLSSR